MQRTAKRKSEVSTSVVRVQSSGDGLKNGPLKSTLRSTNGVLNMKRRREQQTVFRSRLKLEKRMFESSEGCQMSNRGQISRAGCSRTGDRQTDQVSLCLSVSCRNTALQ